MIDKENDWYLVVISLTPVLSLSLILCALGCISVSFKIQFYFKMGFFLFCYTSFVQVFWLVIFFASKSILFKCMLPS